MPSAVYLITNTANEHRYAGSAVHPASRKWQHWNRLRRGIHHSRHLQNAWQKYGEACFVFRVLFRCDRENLLVFEQRAINVLRPEYNVAPRASNPMLGRHHSSESKAKISTGNMGKQLSAETRAKISAAKSTPEARVRAANAALGNKCGLGNRSNPGNHYMSGHKHSAEALAKMSVAATGRKHAPETRAKLAVISRGNKYSLGCRHTSETLAKMSAAHLGKKHTPEQLAKMSAAMKENWRIRRLVQ